MMKRLAYGAVLGLVLSVGLAWSGAAVATADDASDQRSTPRLQFGGHGPTGMCGDGQLSEEAISGAEQDRKGQRIQGHKPDAANEDKER